MSIPAVPHPGRDNPRDMINLDEIKSNHAWSRYPMNGMSFRNLVEESTSARTDMLQYRTMAQVDAQVSKDTFSLISNGVCVFKIPDTLTSDRTVARGRADVYYLDDMDVYLNGEPEELKIEGIPLNQRSLHTSPFSAFRNRTEYFKEHILRRRIGRWVPSNAYETRQFSDMQLASLFPKVSASIRNVVQPAAMPLPSPPVVYHYHRELKEIQDLEDFTELTERQKRLLFCLEHEYYILFLDCWWKEAVHGGRQFVLDIGTINALSFRCAGLTTVAAKPFQVVLEHMRSAATKPELCHNWVMFSEDEMEESAFVWAAHGPNELMAGEYDPSEPSGITLWFNTTNRRISRARGSSSTFLRGKSLLDKTVTVPDLKRIRGLMPIIRRNRWDRRGAIKLSHLLENLVNLQSCTDGLLDRATWTERKRHVEVPARDYTGYICDRQRDNPQASNERGLVLYREDYRDVRYSSGPSSRDGARPNDFNHQDDGRSNYDYTDGRSNYVGYHGDRYRNNSTDYRYENDHASGRGNRRGHDRSYANDDENYDDNEQCDRSGETYGGYERRHEVNGQDEGGREGAYDGNGYHDLDDPSQHENQNIYRNDEGDRYYRTHNPVTDVQVDVFTEGVRTPAVNTPHRNDEQMCSHPQVSDTLSRPVFKPPTRTSTPIVVPGPDGLVLVKPAAPFLSRNQHGRRNIRSDVTEEGQDDSGPSGDVSQLPTGNVPWMLNDNTNPSNCNEETNEETAIEIRRSGNDSLKRPRTDSSPLKGTSTMKEDGDPE